MNQKPQGLLQSLLILEMVWADLTMDFITCLPSFFDPTVIWVVCDRLSKSANFIALPKHFTAQSLAQRFIYDIICLHCDPILVSTFWKEIFKLQGTKHQYWLVYHPWINVQSEVLNRCLEWYLRCFTSDNLRQWFNFLPLVELWYNTSYHSVIDMIPFEAPFGQPLLNIHEHVPLHSTQVDAFVPSMWTTHLSKILPSPPMGAKTLPLIDEPNSSNTSSTSSLMDKGISESDSIVTGQVKEKGPKGNPHRFLLVSNFKY